MVQGTDTKTEFDDVRHGYAPVREHNRAPSQTPNSPDSAPDITMTGQDEPQDAHAQADPNDAGRPEISADTLENSVNALIDSGKAAYQAEISLLRARAGLAVSSTKAMVAYMGIALSAGMVTLLALGFGSIIILSEYLPNEAAVAIVVLSLGAITAFAGWKAKEQFDHITRAIWEQADE